MPTPNATTTTSVTEIIDSEFISRVILDANRPMSVVEQCFWMIDAGGISSSVYAIPKWDKIDVPLSEAAGKAETVEFAATEKTLSDITVTAAVVGIRAALSMEAIDDTIVDLVAAIIRENMNAMREQLDEDGLLNFTSATNAEDFSTLTLTVDRLGVAIATLRALFPMGTRMCFVGAPKQISDLKASIRTNTGAIFGGAMGNQAASGMMDARRLGFVDIYEGVEIYEGNVPDFDGSNHSGGLFIGGERGALATVVWRGMTNVADDEVRRLQTDLITYARYGTAITNQSHLVEVISAK